MRPVRIRWLDLAWAVAAAWTLAQAQVLLHDLGEALAARSMGLQVLGMQPWLFARAPVRLVGDLAGPAGAWVAVGGTLFPWLAVTTVLAVTRPRRPLSRWSAAIVAAWTFASLVPWWVVPLVGRWPVGHDALRFLARTGGGNAWGVALAAGLGAALLVAAAWRATGGVGRLREAWPGVAGLGRRWAAWLGLALAAAAVAGLTWAAARVGGGADAIVPPDGFTVAADVRLTSELRDDQLVGDLASAAHALEVWVEVRDVRGPLQVDLLGPDGERVPVLVLPPGAALAQASARTPPVALEAGPWSLRASTGSRNGRLLVGYREAGP